MPRTYKRVAAGRSTTTETIYALAHRGLALSRDQLYQLSDLVFDQEDIRSGVQRRRHYDADQIEILATAGLLRRLGENDETIAATLRGSSPEAVAPIRDAAQKAIEQIEAVHAMTGRLLASA